jgi:NAD(P)-dependent dehydrogenase (short-subunit alcohol dehydrogenase family)
LYGQVKDAVALQKAANQVSKATGGTLDILINNAAYLGGGPGTRWTRIHELTTAQIEEEFAEGNTVNVVGVIHGTNAFLPLIRAGTTKKVITIGTGAADVDLIAEYSLDNAVSYSATKTATNMVVAKYHAALGHSEGILFVCISPGFVDNHPPDFTNEVEVKGLQDMGAKFMQYAQKEGLEFTGQPITVETSCSLVAGVIDRATVQTMGGAFLSQFGNKKWL